MAKEVLCSISTRGRYNTTLPLTIQSIIFQTALPDKLVIFDDNDIPADLRTFQHYHHLFKLLDEKEISWSVIFGDRKGQHYNHQKANSMGYELIWRIDDDCIAEPTVLAKLLSNITTNVGAVGGSILTPPVRGEISATGKIENIRTEPNLQWGYIKQWREVDHLHCSYLYRAGIQDFNLDLSRVAHREETLHTYGIKRKGYKVIVIPDCITWHLKNNEGGIRNGQRELFEHDEKIFNVALNLWNVKNESKVIVLDNGIGDHYAFKNILPELRKKHKKMTLAVCYPDIFHDEEDLNLISIQDAKNLFGNIDEFNIYIQMDKWGWEGNLIDAFRKLYL